MEQLNLQNIRVDFKKLECSSRYEDVIYNIPFESLAGIDDLTVDQYGEGAEPRIYTEHGQDGDFNITNMAIIATEHPELYQQLRDTRLEIENEIRNQLEQQ
jgi:hypothetical protein